MAMPTSMRGVSIVVGGGTIAMSPGDVVGIYNQDADSIDGDDMWFGREVLYGSPGQRYFGLLSVPSSSPLPPSTMTRQRRRAAARRATKV